MRTFIAVAGIAAALTVGAGQAAAASTPPTFPGIPTTGDTSGSANNALGSLQSLVLCSMFGSTNICAPVNLNPPIA
ncbi:hypothetical protein ACFYUD_01995 [Nocardia tengchongensis]|uniref:hypothetical protein n=1 Tax=Nocardia tengchongensis TaxID=2055889 RepID=UPI0036B18A1C